MAEKGPWVVEADCAPTMLTHDFPVETYRTWVNSTEVGRFAKVYGPTAERSAAFASFIVQAVNSHDALVDALEELRRTTAAYLEYIDHIETRRGFKRKLSADDESMLSEHQSMWSDADDKAVAALALAKQGAQWLNP